MNETIKVLLADDHQMVRGGLRALLETQPGITVIGEAMTGREAVTLAEELSPDIVVMDIDMPDMNGIEATRQIVGSAKGVKVIALSGHADAKFVKGMLAAGGVGYIVKHAAFDELLKAIRTVAESNVYLSPRVAGVLVSDLVQGGISEGTAKFTKLSPREREVLQLVTEGKATKEVAFHLHVSVKTVETHRRNIMEKLDLDSVAKLTKYAIREGITSIDG